MQPDLILIPFGKNATPGTIDPIPKTRGPDDSPQQATWDEGFPQVTMTPLAAGGIPPKGQDFNGVLKAISEHTVFSEHGGQFKWSSGYVDQSGGYSIGDVIQADDGLNSYVSLVNTNTANFNTNPASIGTNWGLYAGRSTQAQATETTLGVTKLSTSALALAGIDDLTSMTPLKVKQALSASSSTDGIAGSHANLKLSATGLNALVAITADTVCVKNAAFVQKVLNTIALSVNLAINGANGLDAGVSAASTWYSVWVIWNGSSVAGLLSLSATAPTMPAGYMYKARVGWTITDSTVSKFTLPINQFGNKAFYAPSAGTNLLSPPSMAAGILGNVNTPTWSPFNVGAFIPQTASIVKFFTSAIAQGIVYMVADSNSYGAYNSTTNPPPIMHNTASTGADFLQFISSLYVGSTRNLFCASNTAVFNVRCLGWEDNL